MKNHALVVALVTFGLLAAACGDDGGTAGSSGGSADCDTVKGYAELSAAFGKCTSCHDSGAPAAGVPNGAYYESYDGAKANAADIGERVADGTMPPSGEPELTADEKSALTTWANCGAPE